MKVAKMKKAAKVPTSAAAMKAGMKKFTPKAGRMKPATYKV